jgi:hypothetical protein
LFTLRALGARLLLEIYRRKRRLLTDGKLLERVPTVAARLGYRRAVRILEADSLVTPAVFGILRPTVVLPASFAAEFTPAQQEAMLAHELAHLAVHDPAWHLLADLVSAALWVHPLVWWARRELRSASEAAADEASLVVADGPGVLASCLVQLGTRLADRRSPGWLSMAGGGFRSGLGLRVERLLHLDRGSRRPIGVVRMVMILILGPALLVTASALSTAWARSPATEEGDEPMSNAWKRSLAAVVFVTALGTADNAPGDDSPKPAGSQAAETKGGTRASKDAEAREQRRLDKDADKIRTEQEGVATELARVLQQIGARDESLSKIDDPDADKVRRELRDLNDRANQLADQKAQLEARLQKLLDKRASLEQGKRAVRIKVFRLKHRDPAEISNVLAELLPQPAPAGMPGMGGGMMPGGGGLMGMSGGLPTLPQPAHGFQGGASGMKGGGGMMPGGMAGGPGGMMAAGQSGGMSMGMMGGGMGGPGRPATGWRVAVDARTGSLVARGTEEELRAISEIIAALDTPEDKSSAKLKNFRTFRLKHSGAAQMASILQELEVKVTVSVLEKGNMLAVSGSEAALKEVGELIDALDVEGKPNKDSGKSQR